MKSLALLALLPLGVAAQTLTVATDVWPPFRMEVDGEIVGYDIDVLAEVAQRTGIEFSVERMPWARALRSIEYGESDLMVGLAYTRERDEYTDYLYYVYKSCRPGFYGDASITDTINTYEDLYQHRIGYVRDSAYFPRFDNDEQLFKVSTAREEQLLQMVSRGNIELLIGTDCQVDYELMQRPDLGLAKAPWQPAERIDLYYGFTEQRQLVAEKDKIEAALQAMTNDGFFDALYKEYFGDPN
ncbi:substrate-binding periplasmic protein [Salinibius halmophilus]|uniref:substrate-binding periplasmic protein n=1 Tax=Salinibius halmophilus TaxID=1853216 RepID=UPI000E6619F7|nr:transporter substrate-binding domain-containing protein [Salinibius halmophilus]